VKILDRFKCWIFKKLIPKDPSLKIELLKDLFPQTNSIFLGIDDIDLGGKKIVNLAERSISRIWLEYPTEDVSLAYLAAINKLRTWGGTAIDWSGVRTVDDFTDKAIEGYCYEKAGLLARQGTNNSNTYFVGYNSGASTKDFSMHKIVNGTHSEIGYESVDLPSNRSYHLWFQVVGSSLKASRNGGETFQISVTDTSLTSGGFGAGGAWYETFRFFGLAYFLRSPKTVIQSTKSIIELNIIGAGVIEDPIRPNFIQKLIEVIDTRIKGIPVRDHVLHESKKYYILKNKGFTIEEIKTLLGYIPQHEIDLASVTWGSFDFANYNDPTVKQGLRKHSHVYVVLIKDGNYYTKDEAIKLQIEHARSKNMYVKVIDGIVDRDKAIEIYKELKARGHDFIAGVDDLWYQLNGNADIEPLAVADFYYGNVINLRRLDLSKVVDVDRTLKTWLDRLNKSRVSESIKEKHRRKLIEVMKKG